MVGISKQNSLEQLSRRLDDSFLRFQMVWNLRDMWKPIT